MQTLFHTLLQTGIPKEVISPLAQYSFVGGFCILFIITTGILFNKLEKSRQTDKEDAKKREDEIIERMMAQFNQQAVSMADSLNQSTSVISELKGIIRENTVTFTKGITVLDRLERKT